MYPWFFVTLIGIVVCGWLIATTWWLLPVVVLTSICGGLLYMIWRLLNSPHDMSGG